MRQNEVYRQMYEDQAHFWTGDMEVEPAALDQVRNISRLPILAGHVALMPDIHYGMGATVGSVIPLNAAVIPAAVGVDIGCFVGETRIPLLDGTQKTLRDLADTTEPFWVYSINDKMKITPGRAVCVKTRTNAALMRVVVSGGEEIICTPDHEFMLSDGTYCQAKNLRFNESLMPLYRNWSSRDGYESVSNGKGTARQTHILVWEAQNGPVPKGRVIHHRDHTHFNNRPDNLEIMTVSDHSAHHRKYGHQFKNSSAEFQERRRVGIAARKADPIKREQMAKVGTKNILSYMETRPEEFKAVVAGNGKRGGRVLLNFNVTPRGYPDCGYLAKNPSALRWHRLREHQTNHKVLVVEPIDRRDDVYCLQVEDHHNFALSAGIFVHNCGMCAVQTSLTAKDLPDSLHSIRLQIERDVPVGFEFHQKEIPLAHQGIDGLHLAATRDNLLSRFSSLRIMQHVGRFDEPRMTRQLGTLGGGNHFIELCLDASQNVWVMLHSGSRNVGKTIGEVATSLAKEQVKKAHIELVDYDLAWFAEGTPLFDEYVEGLNWAQEYARLNRDLMLLLVLGAMRRLLPAFTLVNRAVNCHHNYLSKEHHFGRDMWITRKGAVSAQKGQLGIIPGSMGAKSFIVRGRGCEDAYCSCSHGAGRRMSRGQAKRSFSLQDLQDQTTGVECRKDQGVLDEIPGAYKDIDEVMDAQSELVEVVAVLKQIMCVKG